MSGWDNNPNPKKKRFGEGDERPESHNPPKHEGPKPEFPFPEGPPEEYTGFPDNPPYTFDDSGRDSSIDFRHAKKPTGAVFPERAIAGTGLYAELEPLIDGQLMAERFLFGIPLHSPLTKQKLGPKHMEDFIKRGLGRFQLEAKTNVQLKVMRHRLPFDPNLYNQHIFVECPFKPIRRVLRLAICSSSYVGIFDDRIDGGEPESKKQFPSGGEIYQIPNDWIEMGNATRGYLNVNPLSPAFTALGTAQATGAMGATILQFIGQQGWVPAYWTLECETGLMTEDGQIPVIVNEAIGSAAAIYAIDNLLPLFRVASQSMSVDGLGQSVNDRMIELLQDKRETLEKRYAMIIKHLKVMFGNNFFSSNV
jgi:hypothetical protein